MTKGRKPKPTAVKELTGNPGKRALNEAEPKPPAPRVLPPPPEHLGALAREKWDELAALLYNLGVLTEIDIDALARYCVIYQRWREAEENIVKKGGMILQTAAGNSIQNPFLSIANRCIEQLDKLAAEFGLTPSSRTRVKADLPPEQSKLEEELFGKAVKVKK